MLLTLVSDVTSMRVTPSRSGEPRCPAVGCFHVLLTSSTPGAPGAPEGSPTSWTESAGHMSSVGVIRQSVSTWREPALSRQVQLPSVPDAGLLLDKGHSGCHPIAGDTVGLHSCVPHSSPSWTTPSLFSNPKLLQSVIWSLGGP